MAFELQIELTGMCLVDLTADPSGSGRYFGKAFLLGGRHTPRLTIPAHLVRALDREHLTRGGRAVVVPGGPILAEIDLTGCQVRVDGDASGVSLPYWDKDRERVNNPQVDWRYLDYALDIKHQTGVERLVPDPEAKAAATVVLDQGQLTCIEPANPLMAAARWDVPGQPARLQPVAASLRWTLQPPGADVLILVTRGDETVASIVAGPVEGSGTVVSAAIYSLCELTGNLPGKLQDVAEYSVLLDGQVVPQAPTQHTASVSPDASGCPPVRLIRAY